MRLDAMKALPSRTAFACAPGILRDPHVSEHASISEGYGSSHSITVAGELHGERVRIELHPTDLEGIEHGWTLEEIALIRRRLDRATRGAYA